MIKQLAWNTFKQTGDINTFLELMEVKNIEENINLNGEGNGNNKNEYWRVIWEITIKWLPY